MSSPAEIKSNIDRAIQESEAQIAIMKALKQLCGDGSRKRVLDAVGHLLAADAVMPGVLEAFLRGRKELAIEGKATDAK